MKRILLTGGGTGGHIFPILAVARELKSKTSAEFLLIGSNIKDVDILYKNILTGKWRRYWSWHNLIDVLKIPLGICQAFWYVGRFKPDVIFGKGGYASVPAVVAGWLYRIPIIVHESDTIPGLANRFLARLANKVCISFDKAKDFFPRKKIVMTGNPVRKEILSIGVIHELPLQKQKKSTIFIFGGSQGAQKINQLILPILPELLKKADVIHQSGSGKEIEFKAPGYYQSPFLEKIQDAYAQADLVIARAGANTLAEIAALGKPSIIIPLPSSSYNHQRENARVFEQAKAAVVLDQEKLRPEFLLSRILKLVDHPELQKELSQNIKQLSKPEAAKRIAEEILKLCKKQ